MSKYMFRIEDRQEYQVEIDAANYKEARSKAEQIFQANKKQGTKPNRFGFHIVLEYIRKDKVNEEVPS